MSELMVKLPLRHVALGLALIAVLLAALNLIRLEFDVTYIRNILNAARIDSIAAWYASALWLSCAALLAGGALLARRGEAAGAPAAWGLLALLALFVAVDHATGVHIRLIDLLASLVPGPRLQVWGTAAFLGVVLVTVIFGRWVVALPRARRWLVGGWVLWIIAYIGLGLAGDYIAILSERPYSREFVSLISLLRLLSVIGLLYGLGLYLGSLVHERELPIRGARAVTMRLAALAAAATFGTILLYVLANTTDILSYDPHRFLYLLDTTQEATLPTLFSVALFLICALLLAVIALTRAHYQLRWAGLAVVFVLLSLDEAISGHEQLIAPGRAVASRLSLDLGGLLEFGWVIFGGAFVFALLLAYGRFLYHLPRRTRWLFAIAGLLFVGGALGMELVSGVIVRNLGNESVWKAVQEIIEETLELVGLIVFVYALIDYAGTYIRTVTFRVPLAAQAAPADDRQAAPAAPASAGANAPHPR